MQACFIFIFAVAFLALGNADEEHGQLSHEELERLRAKCGAKDAAVTPFNLCMFHEYGIQNSNGDIDKKILKTKIEKHTRLNADTIVKVVAECGERNGATAEDAANALEECLEKYLNTPGTIYTRSSKHD